MNTKNLIYIGIVVVLIIAGGILVGIYYTQDFNTDFNFQESINYGDIHFETNSYKDYKTNESPAYLTSANAVVGELVLDNKNGIFTKVYSPPRIFGCIDFSDGLSQDSPLYYNNKLIIWYVQDGENTLYGNYNYYEPKKIEVKVGERKTITLMGYYRPNNLKVSEFSKENIKGISIYVVEAGKENPLGNDYDSSYYGYYNIDCRTLKETEESIQKIRIT